MNRHWQQQSLCTLPARPQEPLEQGGLPPLSPPTLPRLCPSAHPGPSHLPGTHKPRPLHLTHRTDKRRAGRHAPGSQFTNWHAVYKNFPSGAEGNRRGVIPEATLSMSFEARASSLARLNHACALGRTSEGREGNRGFKLGYSETFIRVHLHLQIQRDLPTEGKADANWGLEIFFQGGGRRADTRVRCSSEVMRRELYHPLAAQTVGEITHLTARELRGAGETPVYSKTCANVFQL